MTVVRVIGQRPGVQHEQAPGRTAVVVDHGGFGADLWTTPALQEEFDGILRMKLQGSDARSIKPLQTQNSPQRQMRF